MYTLLTCLTPPHYVSMCLSLDKSLKLSSYRLFLCYIFVFRYFFVYEIRPLVLLFELFEIVISGPFIGDYTVWAMLIVEGRTLTYS